MKDDKNFELRRKIINKEFTSNDLCSREEKDFYNPERKKQMQESILKGIEVKVTSEVVPAELKDKTNGSTVTEENNTKVRWGDSLSAKEVSKSKENP